MTERERINREGLGAQGQSGQQSPLGSAADTAQEKAGQLSSTVQERAGQMVDQAGEQARSQVETQKERVVDSLGGLAEALRQTGQQIRENNQGMGMLANFSNQAADSIEQFSERLRSTDTRQMVNEIEHFARRQPALFLGGAFLLGLLGARFLKSSAEQQQSQMMQQTGYAAGPQGYSSQYAGGSQTQRAAYDTTPTSGSPRQASAGAASQGTSGYWPGTMPEQEQRDLERAVGETGTTAGSTPSRTGGSAAGSTPPRTGTAAGATPGTGTTAGATPETGSTAGTSQSPQGYQRDRSDTLTEQTPNYGPGTKSGPDTSGRTTRQLGESSGLGTDKDKGSSPEGR